MRPSIRTRVRVSRKELEARHGPLRTLVAEAVALVTALAAVKGCGWLPCPSPERGRSAPWSPKPSRLKACLVEGLRAAVTARNGDGLCGAVAASWYRGRTQAGSSTIVQSQGSVTAPVPGHGPGRRNQRFFA